jgi:hypothetical protein
MKNRSIRLIVLGFITWLVPFIVSFGFYDRTGDLNVTYGLFKCVMIVVSSLTGMWMLAYHMNFISKNFAREGLITGISWLLINYTLDLLVLLPMSGMSIGQYFMTVGLGYLQIPVICLAVGMIVQRKTSLIKPQQL